jgi:hypothetical protein
MTLCSGVGFQPNAYQGSAFRVSGAAMSAKGQKQSFDPDQPYDRFAPKADIDPHRPQSWSERPHHSAPSTGRHHSCQLNEKFSPALKAL